jgi:hypothetical protein
LARKNASYLLEDDSSGETGIVAITLFTSRGYSKITQFAV